MKMVGGLGWGDGCECWGEGGWGVACVCDANSKLNISSYRSVEIREGRIRGRRVRGREEMQRHAHVLATMSVTSSMSSSSSSSTSRVGDHWGSSACMSATASALSHGVPASNTVTLLR